MSNEIEVKSNIGEQTKDFLSGQNRTVVGAEDLAAIKVTLDEFKQFTHSFNTTTAPQLVQILNQHTKEISDLTKQVNLMLEILLKQKIDQLNNGQK